MMSEKKCAVAGILVCVAIFVGVAVWYFNTVHPTWVVGWLAWLAMVGSALGAYGFGRKLDFLLKEQGVLEEQEHTRWNTLPATRALRAIHPR